MPSQHAQVTASHVFGLVLYLFPLHIEIHSIYYGYHIMSSNIENLTLLLPYFTEHTFVTRSDVDSRTSVVTAIDQWGSGPWIQSCVHVIQVMISYRSFAFFAWTCSYHGYQYEISA